MKALKWINTTAFLSMIAVSVLANVLLIGGNTTLQIAEAYPTLFLPAPATFCIWRIIYLLLVVFIAYQWGIFDHGTNSSEVRERIGLWFAVSCTLNIAWIFLWHFRMIGLATACIYLLLISLIVIQKRLTGIGGNLLQRSAAKASLSLYYGWIVAASIANVSIFLVQFGWDGWGFPDGFWTSVMLIIGAGITCAIVLIGRNRTVAIAVVWAYAGILIRHISPVYHAALHPFVIIVAFLCEVLILIAMAVSEIEDLFRKKGCYAQH